MARSTPNASRKEPGARSISHEEIAAYAYYLWEHEGRPSGRAEELWLQAEAQLRLSLLPDFHP
jgi:hypothetical protein